MIAAFIFFRIFESCKSRTGAAEPGAGADFACTLPGLPVRAGIYCEAKIIQAAPTAKFIWRLWPCGLFSGEIGARTAYLRPVLSSCSPPPCPVSSARRVAALLRYVRSLRHAAPLSPHRGHRITCCPPLHRFPPRPFPGHPPGIHPTHDRLPSSVSALPRYSLSWHPPFPVPSRPFLSRLVPPLYSLFPAPAVPVVFLGGRRFWHENAKYFFIWEIIVNFLLLLAFNVK